MALVPVYKPLGWTPLQTIDALRASQAEFRDVPITYAGRLDPMAEGVLLLLTGDDRLRRDEFLKLDKEYRATILFGCSSDSYDALGVVERGTVVDESRIELALHKLVGAHKLPFPPYSSYKMQGKPLHWWAQQGRLQEIDVPLKLMAVAEVRDVTVEQRSTPAMLADVTRRIGLVHGDFRQQAIASRWRDVLTEYQSLIVASCVLTVTSGTYVRALAHELGRVLGSGALSLELKRTRVGAWTEENCLRVQ